MRLIQFEQENGKRQVGVVEGATVTVVRGVETTWELARQAINQRKTLSALIAELGLESEHDYTKLLADKRVLAPLDHPDPAHCLITGTGLTHLGSAAARDKMHQQTEQTEEALTDTMKMFKWGVAGGKPQEGQIGVQPEWFYKGDGQTVVRPGTALDYPDFAEDGGDEPEICGLYVIGEDGKPYRLGYCLGNEYSDHVMERRNYLYLSHSKLRQCSYGPELRLGQLPSHLKGMSRVRRGGEVIWEREFLSGEDNMCHTIANLEHHHFKYRQFLRPGDVHVHFFGTATISFADGLNLQPGDEMEVELPDFGAPLKNTLRATQSEPVKITPL
ncbi:FAH family protein [Pantoea sp. Ap-967]|uniref:AraD1 family protein n=1 Tax=Pantoea sp. Ap-967 TaxID=2608362 RepID=UPI00141E5A5E|nr:AraD1 family protein [Pantoea sp. Ap-967]NIE73315.1 FAH family protein [Pantoea sp. Ap-967]